MALLRLLDRHWFTSAPALRLALLRILLGSFTLFYLARRTRMLLQIARSDPALFKPVGVIAGLQQPPAPHVVRAVLMLTLITNVLFVLGWRHRVNGPLFGGLLLWLMCYRNSWSMIYHNDNVLVLHALILAVAPAADACAIDAQRPAAGGGPVDPHWRYGWPIQLMNTVTALTYFLSAIAKLAGPLGSHWTSGKALRSQIAVDALRKEVLGSNSSRLAFILYDKVALFQLLAWGSLITELVAPLVLLDKRLSRLWVGGAFLMHWGIFVMMRINFRYQLSGLIFVPFFDLERLTTAIDGRLREFHDTMIRNIDHG